MISRDVSSVQTLPSCNRLNDEAARLMSALRVEPCVLEVYFKQIGSVRLLQLQTGQLLTLRSLCLYLDQTSL